MPAEPLIRPLQAGRESRSGVATTRLTRDQPASRDLGLDVVEERVVGERLPVTPPAILQPHDVGKRRVANWQRLGGMRPRSASWTRWRRLTWRLRVRSDARSARSAATTTRRRRLGGGTVQVRLRSAARSAEGAQRRLLLPVAAIAPPVSWGLPSLPDPVSLQIRVRAAGEGSVGRLDRSGGAASRLRPAYRRVPGRARPRSPELMSVPDCLLSVYARLPVPGHEAA